MKKMIIAALLIAGVAAMPASAKELNIAVLDAQGVINSTNAAKRAVEELKKKTAEGQAKVAEMEKPLVERQNELAEKRSALSPEKYSEMEADLRKDVIKFRAEAQSIQESLDRENVKLRREIAEEVRKVVDEMSEKNGYDLVLPLNGAFFVKDSLNITEEVLKKVNKALDAKK